MPQTKLHNKSVPNIPTMVKISSPTFLLSSNFLPQPQSSNHTYLAFSYVFPHYDKCLSWGQQYQSILLDTQLECLVPTIYSQVYKNLFSLYDYYFPPEIKSIHPYIYPYLPNIYPRLPCHYPPTNPQFQGADSFV